MNWLSSILPGIKKNRDKNKQDKDTGEWKTCKQCNATNYLLELKRASFVCPSCDYHARITAEERASITFDDSSEYIEIGGDIRAVNVIKFDDGQPYEDRLKKSQKGDARREAARVYYGTIEKQPVVAVIFDFSFMGGSMGSVVGERFARGIDMALRHRSAFVTFSSSGGARMQEGLVSLLQMTKTTSLLSKLAYFKLPHISVLTDPTTGGVAASFAMIGDIVIAEPNALIGFAGPRVIQETVREQLPKGFQCSDFLRNHGAVDIICDRRELKNKLGKVLGLLLKQG